METITTNIEFYSEVLEDDIVLPVSVNYEVVDASYYDGTRGGRFGSTPVEIDYKGAGFVSSDITVLKEVSNEIKEEVINSFDDYEDTLREEIENNLNN